MKSTILKYLSGKGSPEEQKKILDWVRNEGNLAEFQTIKDEWKKDTIRKEMPDEFQGEWNNIQNKLLSQMQVKMKRTQRTLFFFRYAAILLLIVAVPALLYFSVNREVPTGLTYTTVVADPGQISKIVLPDSSIIWINSGSTIRYNNEFSQKNRNLELTGEAFFKVTRNTDLPLIVSSNDLQVKVLGTEFCVTAYPNESSIQIVLEKGQVELSSISGPQLNYMMKQGELANFNIEKKELAVKEVNTGLYTSWKEGLTHIYNLPLSEVVIRLERRYNQKFVVDDAIKNLPYTFTIKNEDLNDVLGLMEKITPVTAIQNGKVIELKYRH